MHEYQSKDTKKAKTRKKGKIGGNYTRDKKEEDMENDIRKTGLIRWNTGGYYRLNRMDEGRISRENMKRIQNWKNYRPRRIRWDEHTSGGMRRSNGNGW